MAEVAAAPLIGSTPTPEAELVEQLQQLDGSRAGHFGMQLHVSRLGAHNRREQHLRTATDTLQAVVRNKNGRLYELATKDLVAVIPDTDADEVKETVDKVRFLFSEDPLTKRHEDGTDKFASVFDLHSELPVFLTVARTLEQMSRDWYLRRQMQEIRRTLLNRGDGKPINPSQLQQVEEVLKSADLTNLLRKQPICAAVKGAKPQPVFHELYISIGDLQEQVTPGVSLLSDRWLFQRLTQTLDRRMLELVSQFSSRNMSKSYTINLNVETLLSEAFAVFDRQLRSQTRGALVLEVPIVDVFADMRAFAFARDFVRSRGYRLLVDGTSPMTAPFVDRARLGVDFVKVCWDPQLLEEDDDGRRAALEEMVQASGPARVILYRCDSAEAVTFGQALGISLFQGHGIDEMLGRRRSAATRAAAAAGAGGGRRRAVG